MVQVPPIRIPELTGHEQYALAPLCAANPWFIKKALAQGRGKVWIRDVISRSRDPSCVLTWERMLQMEASGDNVWVAKNIGSLSH